MAVQKRRGEIQMTENTERVTFRITSKLSESIDEVLLKSHYRTRSQFLRAAIENLINETREEWNSKKVVFHVPKVLIVRLDIAVEDGFANSREELINKALEQYLVNIEKYVTQGWEQFQEKRAAFKDSTEHNPSITKS
jgi:metal-responsive CopG/Arc/MetJ family transcriptional regulator